MVIGVSSSVVRRLLAAGSGGAIAGAICGGFECLAKGLPPITLLWAFGLYGSFGLAVGAIAGSAIVVVKPIGCRCAGYELGIGFALGWIATGAIVLRYDPVPTGTPGPTQALLFGLLSLALFGGLLLELGPRIRALQPGPLALALPWGCCGLFLVGLAWASLPAPQTPAVAVARLAGSGTVMVVVDTLRADVLGAYGAGAHRGDAPSPAFDALADRGMLFLDASAQSSWTVPSMAAVITGTYGAPFQVEDRGSAFASPSPILPVVLSRAGVRTAAVVANPILTADRFAEGFDLFRPVERPTLLALPGQWTRRLVGVQASIRALEIAFGANGSFANCDTVNRHARRLLNEIGDQRFFLWVQYMDPHTPYFGKDGVVGYRSSVTTAARRRAYRDEVRRVDGCLADLLGALEASGLQNRTTVVVMSDHGEELLDHGGVGHSHTLYEELIHIPLVIAGPGIDSRRVEHLARQIDIGPTILEGFGLTPPQGWNGVSLLAADSPPTSTIATTWNLVAYRWTDARGATKIIASRQPPHGSGDSTRVFDLAQDPAEARPLPAVSPEGQRLNEALQRELRRLDLPSARGARIAIPPELDERLRALGYD